MARDEEKHEDYGESMKSDTKAPPEEACNAYYLRKQRTKGNKFAPDVEAEIAGPDRDREASDSDVRDKDGFINYKRWDKYRGG